MTLVFAAPWRHPIGKLWLSITALVVITVTVAALSIWRDYEVTERDVRSDLVDLGVVLEQHASSVFLPAASAISNAVALANKLDDEQLKRGEGSREAAEIVRLTGVFSVWIVDRDGRPLLATNFPELPKLDVSDRAYFQDARQTPGRMFVSPILTTKINGVPVITLSHGLVDASGAFRGVAIVAVHGAAFTNLYPSLRRESGQAFALFRDDGAVIFREPWPTEASQRSKGLPDLIQKEPAGIRVAPSSFDGLQRYQVWRRIPGLPVVVGLSQPVDDVFAAWAERAIWNSAACLTVVLALCGTGIAGRRMLVRESQAAAALAESEDRTRLALQLSPIALVALDRELRYVWVRNNRIGATGEYKGSKPSDYFDAEGAAAKEALFRRAMDEGQQVREQIRTRPLRAPAPQVFDIVAEPLRNPSGDIVGVVAAAVDVTDRMRHQYDLEQALAQRNVLLEEVHHRVKNNLQIIQSLLTIESLSASEEARPGYERSLARVQAMGLVHSLLYRSGEYSDVDIADYVQALVAGLAEVSGDTAVEVDVVPLRLPLDRAVPFGMIINEALWNAIKHANGQAVRIKAQIDGPNLAVEISDHGPGFAPSETSGVGLRLMRGLAVQLDGDIEFMTGAQGGALVRLTLPRDVPSGETAPEKAASV